MNILKASLLSLTALLAAAAVSLPAAAAESTPSYAHPPTGETIRGTIASIDAKYHITVRDERGYIDDVTLHPGTIINPTGLTLARGQRVTINGEPSGGTLIANEIDTPYHYSYVIPVYYPYPPYPLYDLRYGFGYPRYRFGFGFRG